MEDTRRPLQVQEDGLGLGVGWLCCVLGGAARFSLGAGVKEEPVVWGRQSWPRGVWGADSKAKGRAQVWAIPAGDTGPTSALQSPGWMLPVCPQRVQGVQAVPGLAPPPGSPHGLEHCADHSGNSEPLRSSRGYLMAWDAFKTRTHEPLPQRRGHLQAGLGSSRPHGNG